MTGVQVKIDLKGAAAIDEALDRIAKAGADLAEPLAEIGEHLLSSHRERWADEQAPDGTPWQPLEPSYAARKRRKRPAAGILVYDDLLAGLLRYQVAGNTLTFGTDRDYGATHQFGRKEDGIPARPWLGIAGEDRDVILDTIHDHLAQALGRA